MLVQRVLAARAGTQTSLLQELEQGSLASALSAGAGVLWMNRGSERLALAQWGR